MTIEGPDSKQPRIEKIEGKNVSVNQSGGITGDVHIGPGRRQLMRPELGQLQRELQEAGERTVSLTATLGDAESYEFAIQLSNMIERIGWKLAPEGVSQGVFSIPIRGIDITVAATRREEIDPAILRLSKWLAEVGLGPVAVSMNSGQLNPEIRVGAV